MEVILLERIEKLGQMGDLVKVKPGYARNYLLPQGKALRANKANMAKFEEQRGQLDAANLERRSDAEVAAAILNGFTCNLLRQASDSDQLYGSVTARDIAGAASDSGVSIARNQILLERPIKTLGIHPIRIALHPEVIVTIGINVARTTGEAEAQMLASRRPAASAGGEDQAQGRAHRYHHERIPVGGEEPGEGMVAREHLFADNCLIELPRVQDQFRRSQTL